METSKRHSDILNQILSVTNNKLLAEYRECITTIILGLDILEYVNDSQNNKELVQIIRHSFEKIFEFFLEDENQHIAKPP